VRVRDHVVLSAAAAALLRPWAGRPALGLLAGGVLIDADHYAWFCLRRRSLNPLAAVRYFNEAHPAQRRGTRALHSPIAVLAVLAAGLRRRQLLPVALGMGLHVALDADHRTRMSRAQVSALKRDDFCCQACGSRAPHIHTHLRHQPWLLPSYAVQNLISLCPPCHEAAHACRRDTVPWT
jgi:hypothetical protein